MLFHAGFAAFSGGFVGVDVFFVISGYLITSIIMVEQENGTFTLARFYERRARRILPALFLVIGACLPAAWLLLPQRDWQDFSRSVAAVAVFASNILFWRESNYFDTAAELKPLLHTWSLAVEEQYYVVYPLFLAAAWPLGVRAIGIMLGTAALLSLAAAQFGGFSPSAAFYLLPTRAWELAVGAFVALITSRRTPSRSSWSEIAGAVGLAMVLVAVVGYSRSTPFPGVYALLPTVGAALILLYATPDTVVGRLLASAPLVGVGLVSYSADLWHQPLLAFARQWQPQQIPSGELLLLLLLSLLLAYCSWRFVEQPFRDRARVGRPALVRITALGSVAMLGAGLAGQYMPPRAKPLDAMQLAATPLKTARPCGLASLPAALMQNCRVIGADTTPNLLLFGDSHAEAIQFALEEALSARGESAYVFTSGGCTPIKDVALNAPVIFRACLDHNRYVFDTFVRDSGVRSVIVMSRWTVYWLEAPFDNHEGGVELRVSPGTESAVLAGVVDGHTTTDKAAIRGLYYRSLEELSAVAKVMVVYPVPEAGWNVPRLIDEQRRSGSALTPAFASVSSAGFRQRNAPVHELFDAYPGPLVRIRPETVFCDTDVPGRCVTHRNGVPLYYDDDHLSDAGARLLVAEILRAGAAQ